MFVIGANGWYKVIVPITLARIPHAKQVAVRALQLAGYSNNKICKIVDISRDSVIAISRLLPANNTDVENCKKQLINESYGLTTRAFIRVTDEKLDAMNALQLTTIAAIGIDKARDMEGNNRPVFNIISVAADITKGIAELERKQATLLACEPQAKSLEIPA